MEMQQLYKYNKHQLKLYSIFTLCIPILPAHTNLSTPSAFSAFNPTRCHVWYESITLQNTPSNAATNVTPPISGQYLRMADNGKANIPLLVCHHHSGGLNGICLANKSTTAADSQQIANTIKGIVSCPCMPSSPRINGKMAQPRLAETSCRPTSPRPVDVSRVAMIMAAFKRVMTAAGKMSATLRMIRYDQKVTCTSPTICRKVGCKSYIFGLMYFK